MSSIKDEATRAALRYYERIIGQALAEGASVEAIDLYLESLGVKDPVIWRQSTERRKIMPMLGGGELTKLGGRNPFRALFGLEPIEQKPEPTLDFPLTESGDAELFAQLNAEALRYDHRRGRWLINDPRSGLWLQDRTESVYNLALVAIRERQARALHLDDYARRKEMQVWAIHGESRARLGNLLALSEKKDPIADSGEHWDESPWLLGCYNGVIDLRTGQHRLAEPEDRVTMRVKVAFDAQAVCPTWEKTVREVFTLPVTTSEGLIEQIDESEIDRIVAFMQRALGYSITGDCREECCFFAWGIGNNGKGTLMNTIGWLLGDYTDDMPYSTLEKSVYKSQSIPNDVAKLDAKRFVTCSEVNEFTMNEARLKALTGRDPLTARFLNQEFFTFQPVCKIWIATNNKPKIVGLDDGIWRRIHLIPFTRAFEGVNRNLKLKDTLRTELPGILNWLIRGVQMWLEDGLNPPETIRQATESYRHESEPIGPFIEACCIVKAGCRVQAAHAWEAYRDWSSQNHEDVVLTNKAFFKMMGKRFTVEPGRQVYYSGVGLMDTRSTQQPEPGF